MYVTSSSKGREENTNERTRIRVWKITKIDSSKMSLEPEHGTIGLLITLLIIILLAVISYELDVWEKVKKNQQSRKFSQKVLFIFNKFIIFVCFVQ